MTTKEDHYQTLQINPNARPEIIKAAYKTLMQIYHPDIYKGKDDIAKRIIEAKRVLTDNKLKAEYDRERSNLKGQTINGYEIQELISDGELGTTYKARNVLTDKLVCIKHAHYATAEDEELILNEAQTLWDLRHYSIPTMRDVLKLEDGSLALVMSYIPGPTLEQIIKKTDGLEQEHVMWIAERCTNALKYLHYNSVVHGDIRPSNIIVQPESHTIALVNYGLSSIRPSNDTKLRGYTPQFASPEQLRGEKALPESDFYSLGLTMIYALGGDASKREVPSDVDDRICSFIKKLIVYDSAFRPNWAKEDLVDTIQKLRLQVFGNKSSNMKPIVGI